jgi:PAS domain S-box-containing protein
MGRQEMKKEEFPAEGAQSKHEQQLIPESDISELIIESIDFPLFIVDAGDCTIRRVNSASALGVQAIGTPCYKAFHGQEQACVESEFLCPVEEVRRTGKSCILDRFHRDDRGDIVQYTEIHAHPIFDRAGTLEQVMIILIDVTERKALEKELKDSESKYSSLFKYIPIGINLVSVDGRILESNPAMTVLTGYSESELGKMNIRALFQDQKEYETFWKKRGKVARIGHHSEVSLGRKDGTWFHATAAVTRFILNHSEVVLFSAIDISPRKKAEAEQKSTLEMLKEKQATLQQKNVALAELINQVDIEKNLLKNQISTNIREVIFPLLEKMKLTEVGNGYLDMIKSSIEDIAGKFGIEFSQMAPRLSPRELEITTMIHSGLTSKQIANLLGLSYETVEKHRRNIRRKIGITGKKINLATYLRADSFYRPPRS